MGYILFIIDSIYYHMPWNDVLLQQKFFFKICRILSIEKHYFIIYNYQLIYHLITKLYQRVAQ